jgi:hypothetical protein
MDEMKGNIVKFKLPIEVMGGFYYNTRIVRARELVKMAISDCRIGTVSCKACFRGDTLHGRQK